MGRRIASLQRLQALQVNAEKCDAQTLDAVGTVRNLKHLSMLSCNHHAMGVIHSILLSSASTLRSLVVEGDEYGPTLLEGWERMVSADDALSKQNHSLSALKTFGLSFTSFTKMTIASLHKAIDFVGLHTLNIGELSHGKLLFFQYLADLMTASRQSITGIRLRHLIVEMSAAHADEPTMTKMTSLLVSSFDTLTDLEFGNYGQYPVTVATNPGLSPKLLQAIIKHKHLQTLKMSCSGVSSGGKIPYLSAVTVGIIVDKLPQLREFNFAPDENQSVGTLHSPMEQILQAC
jgi:hypothetical protein